MSFELVMPRAGLTMVEGTISAWTGSARSGVCVLIAVLSGGLIAGQLSGRGGQRGRLRAPVPLSLGQAVDAAAHTMLLVCGTMALLRVAAALAGEALMPLSLIHI